MMDAQIPNCQMENGFGIMKMELLGKKYILREGFASVSSFGMIKMVI